MGVNSASTGFFTPDNYRDRLVVRSFLMLGIFLIASSFTKSSDPGIRAKEANIIIRQIGHRLLLQAGDSTSRVLPVTETKGGTFLLKFENEFAFSHDSLIMLAKGLLPKTQFPSGYTVTVQECMNTAIVYGFKVNNTSGDILPCKGRKEPPGCYTIEIALPDLYENAEPSKADIDPLPEEPQQSLKVDHHEADTKLKAIKSLKADPQKTKPKLEELKSFKIDPQESKPKPEQFKSSKVDPQEANPIPIAIGIEEFKTTTFDYPVINLVCTGILVLLSVTLIGRFRERLVPVPVQIQDHSTIQNDAIIKEPVSVLGKFLFDVKGQRLLLGSEVISLTDKEYKILELLNKNFGVLIPRETLMQKIWINEGVITGRSLDMFVSKLRKKISSDPDLRITNVHGKGYKLESGAVPSR